MRNFIVITLIVFFFSACARKLNINSTHYEIKAKAKLQSGDSGVTKSPPEGLVYYLPKNLIRIKITYTVREVTRIVNGNPNPEKYDIIFKKPIEVETELVSDMDNAFVIDGKRITNSTWLKSVLEFNLFPSGLMKSVTAEIEDQSADLAKNIILTSGELAKTFVSPIGFGAKNIGEADKRISYEEIYENAVVDELLKDANKVNISDEDIQNFLRNEKYSFLVESDPAIIKTREIIQKNEINSVTFFKNIREKIKLRDRDENYYLEQIDNLNDRISLSENQDKFDFYKKKIDYFKKQLQWYKSLNMIQEKEYEIVFEAVLDPFKEYNSKNKKGISTKTTNNPDESITYTHSIRPYYLFESLIGKYSDDSSILTKEKKVKEILDLPKVELSIDNSTRKASITNEILKKSGELRGLVVRQPIQTQARLYINDNLITSNAINIAQLGHESIIPLNSNKGGKIQTNLSFDGLSGALVHHKITNIKSSIEQANELISETGNTLTGTYDYLKYEKPTKELQRLIDLKTKLDELVPSESQNVLDEITLIQNQINLINIQTQLKELLEEIEKKNSSDSTEE